MTSRAGGADAPEFVESRDPSTGEVWTRYPCDGEREVAAAVARARTAQGAWRERTLAQRLAVLARAREHLFARRDEVARLITRENGKPVAEAMASEVVTTLDILRFSTRHAAQELAPRRVRSGALALWRKRITIAQEPYGVVAVISPWNYPFLLPAGIVAPALVAGNAVVLKPSELTPTSAEMLRELFLEAGVPPHVLQLVHGAGATGAALVASAVDKVFFTGSVLTGRRVAVACAERLVPYVLELGGSDPAIVLADADVEHAASGIVWGRCSNGGQTCVAPKRVYVEAPIHDRLVAAIAQRFGRLRIGGERDGEGDVGPLIRPSHRATLDAMREDALAGGARLAGHSGVTGGGHGAFFPPALLVDLAPTARVLHEETFGPLLPVVRVRDAEEAITLANASAFGLSASVWTRDRARGRAIASRLQAGSVALNDVALVAGMAEVPHGGMKASGQGRAHGLEGLRECVRTRTVVDDILPSRRQPWWFGYAASTLRGSDAYARLAHGRSVRERLSGVAGTLTLLLRPERPI